MWGAGKTIGNGADCGKLEGTCQSRRKSQHSAPSDLLPSYNGSSLQTDHVISSGKPK